MQLFLLNAVFTPKITVLITTTLNLASSFFNLNELGDPLFHYQIEISMVRFNHSHLKRKLIKSLNLD